LVRYQCYLAFARLRDVKNARAQLTYFCELEPKNGDAQSVLTRLGGPDTTVPPLPRAQKSGVWYDGTGHSVTDGDDFDRDLASDDAEPPPGPDVLVCPGCSKRTWKGWFCKHCGETLPRG